jgi:hypothetical protein
MYRKRYTCTISETASKLRDLLLEAIAIQEISKSNSPNNPNNAHPSYAVLRSSCLTRHLISLFAIQWNLGGAKELVSAVPKNRCKRRIVGWGMSLSAGSVTCCRAAWRTRDQIQSTKLFNSVRGWFGMTTKGKEFGRNPLIWYRPRVRRKKRT